MKREKEDKAYPFSIRLTQAEKQHLQERAGKAPLGAFVRESLLSEGAPPRRTRRSYAVKDGEALGQLLGLLGQSRIANNLNQLAKAANLGALPVLKETEDDLKSACAAVLEMRRLLLTALGIAIMDQALPRQSISRMFTEQADGGRS